MTVFERFGKNYYGDARIKIKVYDGIKYDLRSQKIGEIERNIVRWGIFNLKDFNEADREDIINNDMLDENDEYLRIWTYDEGDGSEHATYRNSHVEMFII